MTTALLGFGIGALFGALLFLAGLADPDKIIGTLRLKDFHAMRVIAVFVLVGMLGTWLLNLAGVANLSIKPAVIVNVLIGGALLGTGFGLIGYCPGTGLACAAAGRLDALVCSCGMLFGALAYILSYEKIVAPLEQVATLGKVTLPEVTQVPAIVYVLVFAVGGGIALYLTRPRLRAAR